MEKENKEEKEVRKRRTKYQVEQDIKWAVKMLTRGWTTRKMVEHMMENMDYDTDGNCRKIIQQAYKVIKIDNDIDLEELTGRYVNMYLTIINKAMGDEETNSSDLKNAIKALDSLTKLQGLITNKFEGKIDGFEVEF